MKSGISRYFELEFEPINWLPGLDDVDNTVGGGGSTLWTNCNLY
jgi:hypothetical protein